MFSFFRVALPFMLILASLSLKSQNMPNSSTTWPKNQISPDYYPGTAPYYLRYVENLGYRKFTPIGAAYQDWYDFKNYYYRDLRKRLRNYHNYR